MSKGLKVGMSFIHLNSMEIYKEFSKGKKFPNAEKFSKKGICLPTSYQLNEYDIKRICKTINSILD